MSASSSACSVAAPSPLENAVLGYGLETTGVDHDKAAFADATLTVLTVTGKPGKSATSAERDRVRPIEQRAFADVWAADEGNGGKHEVRRGA